MKHIKIAIADDHPLYIDGIKLALDDNPEIIIVGEAFNGKEIIKIVDNKNPDVVLLDIRMPEVDGIESAKIIKERFGQTKIVVLTQYNSKALISHCQKIGVEGYLLKDCGKKELIKAIKTVMNGGVYFNIRNGQANGILLNNYSNLKAVVSKRELEVLKLLANDFCCDEIALKLGVCITSIKTYRNRLKNKAGTNTLTGLIGWAHQNEII